MNWTTHQLDDETGPLSYHWTRDDGREIRPVVTANIPKTDIQYELVDRGKALGLFGSVRAAKAMP